MGYIDLPFEQDDRATRIVEAARRDVLLADAEEAHARRTRSLVRELARAFPDKDEGQHIDMANEVPRHLLKAAPYVRADDESDETGTVLAELRRAFPDRHEGKTELARTQNGTDLLGNRARGSGWYVGE